MGSTANKRVKNYKRVKAHGKWTSVSVEIPKLKPDKRPEGVNNLRDFLRKSNPCTMVGSAESIHCPTLLT